MKTAMTIHKAELRLETKGNGDMHDITSRVKEIIDSSGLTDGLTTVHVPGSTASVTTIEFEPGLRKDFPQALERIIPSGIRYAHDDTWHDSNGHSHVRSALMGPNLTIPFSDGNLVLGTWQQIVLVDWDNRPRERRLFVMCIGE